MVRIYNQGILAEKVGGRVFFFGRRLKKGKRGRIGDLRRASGLREAKETGNAMLRRRRISRGAACEFSGGFVE